VDEASRLQRKRGPDHVFADSLYISLSLRPDLAVDVEACVVPVEDLPHQGKSDELFPEKQGEDILHKNYKDFVFAHAANRSKLPSISTF